MDASGRQAVNSAKRPLLADLKAEIRGLSTDVREMLRLRWELIRLELQADLMALKRLAVILIAATVMALTSLPLFFVSLADALHGRLGIARWGWLLIFGVGLLIIAGLSAYIGRILFLRRFSGLKETLAELREDLEWLKEGVRRRGSESETDR